MSNVRRLHQGNWRWQEVDKLSYKSQGSGPFRAVTRQVLFDDPGLACQLRYFEIEPGGFSTLERHEHVHGVLVMRGHGQCLVGREILAISPQDLITVPPLAWHQFRATNGEPLGFLCMVNAERDRPMLPTREDLAALRDDAGIAAFIRLEDAC